MKGLGHILIRYVGAAIGIGICLLVLNVASLIQLTVACNVPEAEIKDRVQLIADGVQQQPDGTFTVSAKAQQALAERYAWAMQLDGTGAVIWSDRMPADLPRQYTVAEVAAFSRWYLRDYPVYCWQNDAGLMVMAGAEESEWKYNIVMAKRTIDEYIDWLPVAFWLNLLAVLLLALLMGWQMYRAMSPVAQGLGELADGEIVELPEHGVLRILSANLNRASKKLQEQQQALGRRDRTRTEWIAGVSHDIRTPLSLVQGAAAQLAENTALPHWAQQKAAMICAQSQRIGRLVDGLNLASKLAYELQPLHLTKFRPAALLRAVAADTLNSQPGERVTLTVSIPAELGMLTVVGDETLLIRAVDNLVRNSIDHNQGEITVDLSLSAMQDTWHITVLDNGSGLSEETLSRLGRQQMQEIPAHGLGLVLVQQIAQAHHGTVYFANQHPGLQVTLTLPQQGGRLIPAQNEKTIVNLKRP